MADRVVVTEDGDAKCCKGRVWTTEVLGQTGLQTTRHASHSENCKVENPASAKNPVDLTTRKRKAAKAGK